MEKLAVKSQHKSLQYCRDCQPSWLKKVSALFANCAGDNSQYLLLEVFVMSIFTVPADFRIESIKEIAKLNENISIKIDEVYGNLKASTLGSGRKYSGLPEASKEQIVEYINFAKKNNIKFNYTINASCLQNGEYKSESRENIIHQISGLIDYGVEHVTIALPSLIEIIRKEFPQLKVTVSVITGIDSLSKLEAFCEYENVDNIYIHEKAYRNFSLLKSLTKIAYSHNKKIGVIANSFCLSDCPYRQYHYNYGAHATIESGMIPEYYGYKCALIKFDNKRNVLNMPWIRPDDINKYIDIGIDRFKVSGREMHNNDADINKVVSIYNDGFFNGNLAELLMCFSKSVYSEVFNIKNSVEVAQFLQDVFDEKILCNRYGCSKCQKCHKALSSIEVNSAALCKWTEFFENKINDFREGKIN